MGGRKKEASSGTELRERGQITTSAGINSHRRKDQSELNRSRREENTGHVRGQPPY